MSHSARLGDRTGPDRIGGHPDVPIVVDLDGTLIRTDSLVENVLALGRSAPLQLLRIPQLLLAGRARFKAEVARLAALPAETLPYNRDLISFLRDERDAGRQIVLATAATAAMAERVATHLDLFDDVLASTEAENLKGAAKLRAIMARLGDAFIYVGDHSADLPIWQAARAGMYAGPARRPAALAGLDFAREFHTEPASLATWVSALRLHQWVKNVLLLVPLLTSFSFGLIGAVIPALLGFVAFGLLASATYVANDLLDLANDRAHPRKRNRGFASGRLSPLAGIGVASGLGIAAFALASLLPQTFGLLLLAYLCCTLAYSTVLKRYVLIDVLMLAALYTLRIVAGAAACAVPISPWLLAFSIFLFVGLALTKRCSELVTLSAAGQAGTIGRDYRVGDLAVLWPLGIAASIASAVVFGLFISAPATRLRYGTPELLWLVLPGLIYWLGRIWIKAVRGEMHDDPIIFAASDGGSRLAIGFMLLAMLAAHAVTLDVALLN